MPLPSVSTPKFSIKIPSLNKEVEFRPFLVKEEKILLIAGQTEDEQEKDRNILTAVRQIIKNCSLEDLNVDKLAVFDLEYVFLKLRAVSVNNICKMAFEDTEDGETYKFDINLDKVELTTNPEHTNIIEIVDGIKIVMRYPTVDIADRFADAENEVQILDQLILGSIDKIYDEETVYEDYTDEELLKFIDGLPTRVYEQFQKFFDTMPRLGYKIEYTNNNGKKRTIEFRSLKDFFTWQ